MHNIIRYIEVAENILCIYRNYLFCRQRFKPLIKFRIVIEVMIFPLIIFSNLFFTIQEQDEFNLIDIYSGPSFIFFGDVLLGFLSKSKSAAYKIFVDNLMVVHNVYNENVNYRRGLKRLYIVIFTSFTVILVVIVCFIATFILSLMTIGVSSSTLSALTALYSLFRNLITYILEYVALYIFLSLLTNLLICLNTTILEIQKKRELDTEYSYSILVDELTQWADLYDCLVESGKHLSACFSDYVSIIQT